jgi:type I restriction enzyme, S subunit
VNSIFEKRKLKYAASVNDDALSESTDPDFELKYIDIGNVDSYGHIHEIASYSFEKSPSRARRQVKHGDVIISTVRTYLQAIAPIKNPETNLVVSTGFAVARPNPSILSDDYFKYVARELSFLWEVEARSKGVSYPAINSSELVDILIPLPPIEIQEKIASYIDQEATEIDVLVAEKKRMISLLEEKGKALANNAVTYGLNPNTSFKPSGLNWLGDIPQHWKIKKLGYLASLKSGETITADTIARQGTYPVYGGNGLRGYTDSFTHSGNYVLIGRQGALCGNINYAQGEFWASEHAIVATPLEEYDYRWLGALLLAMNLNQYSLSAAQPGISIDRISAIKIPVPPLEEQYWIAEYLEREPAKIDPLVTSIADSITLLNERRSALITAAVTGQIKLEDMVV